MAKKDLSRLSRKELIDVIEQMLDDKESPSDETVTRADVTAEQQRLSYRQKYLRTLRSTLSILIVVAAAAVLISTLFLPVIQVSGDSMEPALSDGDVLLLHKTRHADYGELCCVSWQNKLLLKRIIGLPGDTIDIDAEGNVRVNGELLDEPYVTDKGLGECDIVFPYHVPEGKYFVMGDRRLTSIDSRSSSIGCVGTDQIIGEVMVRLWPFGKIE